MMAELRQRSGHKLPEGYAYASQEDFIATHGVSFRSAKLSPGERKLVLGAAERCHESFPIKECYRNSVILVSAEPRLTYVEGLFISERVGIPIQHAWVVIDDKVVDMTARRSGPVGRGRWGDRVLGEFPEGRHYFGVSFHGDQVLDAAVDKRWSGAMIDDWQRHWPMLKAGAYRPPG